MPAIAVITLIVVVFVAFMAVLAYGYGRAPGNGWDDTRKS